MDDPVTLERVVHFLLETPLFEGLDPSELAEIVRIMQFQRVRDAHPVFREGDQGDAWYVVFDGEVVVSKGSSFGPSRPLAVLGPHACFGEMSVLEDSTRSATVRARGEATLFRFPRDAFCQLVEEGNLAAHKLVFAMSRVLSQRLRHLTQQLSDLLAEGAVSPAHAHLGPLLDSCAVSE